jgi:hypothetical protein
MPGLARVWPGYGKRRVPKSLMNFGQFRLGIGVTISILVGADHFFHSCQ